MLRPGDGMTESPAATAGFVIRAAQVDDEPAVVELDRLDTGVAKHAYWHDLFARYIGAERENRFIFVAESTPRKDGAEVIGFIVGEVRAWEFGSSPCGWVFAVSVAPDLRLKGVGSALFDTISTRFRRAGVEKIRTMLSRNNHLLMSFFRSHGMMAGPYIQLEKAFDGEVDGGAQE
jgi:GNAT superfamily N-acetyltransferase